MIKKEKLEWIRHKYPILDQHVSKVKQREERYKKRRVDIEIIFTSIVWLSHFIITMICGEPFTILSERCDQFAIFAKLNVFLYMTEESKNERKKEKKVKNTRVFIFETIG